VSASCPAGSVATGGGWFSSSVDIVVPFAKASGSAYNVIGINYSNVAASDTIAAQVVCATGSNVAAVPASAGGTDEFRAALARARSSLAR